VVHLTHIINPTLLNEVAFNYDGNRIHTLPQGLVSAPSGFEFNRLFSGPNASDRIPSINLNGITGANYTANWTPWNNAANDYQVRDDVSWTKGAHQLKFGFSWMLYKKVQSYFANTQGNFNFNGSFTNALRGPGRDDWNLSLFKSFVISESRGSRFELRADAFNTWNHTQFRGDANTGGISLNAGAGNFGAVTAAFDPREFQLGARLIF